MDIRCTQYSVVQLRFLPLPRMELRQKGRGEAEGRVGIQRVVATLASQMF